jgi:hypothetical protein
LVQIAAEASDAEMPVIVVLETEVLDILVLDDKEPDTMDFVWVLLSWRWLSKLSGGSTVVQIIILASA